jgi:4-amino-4-deoxy-L-arabinose transferase-like glycosyltransferase
LTARSTGLVFALALGLRLAFVVSQVDLAWEDEREYVAIGRRLAAGEGFVATSYRSAPVLPAYLGLAFRVFGDGYLAPRIGQAILGALTCLLVAWTANLLVSPGVGVRSGLLLAVYPPQVYLAGVFYTACLETFLCACTVYLAARLLRGRGGSGTAGLAGVALGLTVLTRPVYLVLAPCLVGVCCRAGARRWPLGLAACAALVFGTAVTVLPWTARNHAVYGRFLLVSSGGAVTLWKGNNELADGTADDRFLGWGRDVWRERLDRLAPPERAAVEEKYARLRERVVDRQREVGDEYLALDDVLGPVARAYIAAEPGRALWRAIRKLATFFSAFSPTRTNPLPGWGGMVAAATFYPILALAIAGIPRAPARAPGLLLPHLVVLSMAVLHAGLTSCTRFRLPVDPYLIIGAAFMLVRLERGARSTPQRRA